MASSRRASPARSTPSAAIFRNRSMYHCECSGPVSVNHRGGVLMGETVAGEWSGWPVLQSGSAGLVDEVELHPVEQGGIEDGARVGGPLA